MRHGSTAGAESDRLRRLVWQVLLMVGVGMALAIGSALASDPQAAYAEPPGVGTPAPDEDGKPWRQAGKATVVYDPVTGKYRVVFGDRSMTPPETDAHAGDGSEDWVPPDTSRAEPRDRYGPRNPGDRARDRDRRREQLGGTDAMRLANNLNSASQKLSTAVSKASKSGPAVGFPTATSADVVTPAAIAGTAAVSVAARKSQNSKAQRAARERAGKVDAKTLRDSRNAARKAAQAARRKAESAGHAADQAEEVVRKVNARTEKSLETRREKADQRNGVTPDSDAFERGADGRDDPPATDRSPNGDGPSGSDPSGRPRSGGDGGDPRNNPPTSSAADGSGQPGQESGRRDGSRADGNRPDSTRPAGGAEADRGRTDVADTSGLPVSVDQTVDGDGRDGDRPHRPGTSDSAGNDDGGKGKTVAAEPADAGKDGTGEPDRAGSKDRGGNPKGNTKEPTGGDDAGPADTGPKKGSDTTKPADSAGDPSSTTKTGRARSIVKGSGKASSLLEELLLGGDWLGVDSIKQDLATQQQNVTVAV